MKESKFHRKFPETVVPLNMQLQYSGKT